MSPPDFRLEKEIGKTGRWVGVAPRPRCRNRGEGKSNAFGGDRRRRSNAFEDGGKWSVWRLATAGRFGRKGAYRKMGRFEAMNGNGVRFGSNLEAKGMRKALKDFEGTIVKGAQGRMDGP